MKQKIILFLILIANCAIAQEYGRGLEMDDENYESVPLKAMQTRGLYDKLPSSASLKQYCPTPGNQGSYGTCVAWSSSYAARTILWAKQNHTTDRSVIDANAFSPYFIYRNISHDYSCSNGTRIPDALDVLKWKGDVLKKDFGLDCPTSIPNNLSSSAVNFKIQSYAKLFDLNDISDDKIKTTKKSISEGNPVVFGMLTPPSFSRIYSDVWQPSGAEKSGQFGCPCGDGISRPQCCGHAICIVGYDDYKYGGAFEVMNSWGTNWGNSGFVWIKYDDYTLFTRYAFELINNIVLQPVVVNPQPKPKPTVVVSPQPKPKPAVVVTPQPKPKPTVVVTPQPKPKPAVVVTPQPTPKPTVVVTPQPSPSDNIDFDFAGDLRFVLLDGTEMKANIVEVRGLGVGGDDVPPTPKQTVNPNNFEYDPNLTSGKFIAYRMDKAYSEGTKFRVYLRNNEPAYVYAIAMDNTNTASVLFPHKPNISPVLNYKDNEVALPSEKNYIVMDNIKGTDVFCLLYSKEELDINSLCRQLESQTGTFFQRLYKTLKSQLVPRDYLRYYNQRLRFEIKSNGFGSIVPIVVEIPHN